LRESLRPADHAGAVGVGKKQSLDRLLHSRRGDVDDASATTLTQRRQGEARQSERRHQRQLPGFPPIVVVEVLEGAGGRTAGVVDQDVEPPEPLQGALNNRSQRLGIGRVAGDSECLRTRSERAYLRRGLVEQLFPAREEGDVAPLPRQGQRARPPHPRRGSTDDRDASFKTEIHAFLRIRFSITTIVTPSKLGRLPFVQHG
jgi:hypothetical protein